jgi:hypothetical protein
MTITYPGHGTELNPRKIRRLLDKEPWEEADSYHYNVDAYTQERRIYLGTVFGLTPSGKYYMPWACSNVWGCNTCKGTGSILTTKRRIHKKWASKQKGARRHYMNPKRVVVYVHRDRCDAKHAKRMRIYHNYSRSMRSCTACGGSGSREAHLDEKWREYAESLCESIGASLQNGEADSCDLFVVEYRDTPEDEDGDDGEAEEEPDECGLRSQVLPEASG